MVKGTGRIRSHFNAGGGDTDEDGNPSDKHLSEYGDRGYERGNGICNHDPVYFIYLSFPDKQAGGEKGCRFKGERWEHMNRDVIIEVKDYSAQFGGFRLRNINLDIYKGEIFSILGRTGSGKTVLLESIAGFYHNRAGNIRIEGKNVAEIPLEKRGIGFVYQDFGLFPHMTAFDNISYGLKMRKIQKSERCELIQKTAELLSIGHILNQYPGTLSGGERQRTSLARALVLRPQILLMDEPFSALDQSTRQTMYRQIEEIHAAFGCTILFVTHDFNEAQKMADRIGIMSGGELKTIRNSSDLFQSCEDKELNEFLGIKEEEVAG
jgi:molybdate transport system ATP-binding protein